MPLSVVITTAGRQDSPRSVGLPNSPRRAQRQDPARAPPVGCPRALLAAWARGGPPVNAHVLAGVRRVPGGPMADSHQKGVYGLLSRPRSCLKLRTEPWNCWPNMATAIPRPPILLASAEMVAVSEVISSPAREISVP